MTAKPRALIFSLAYYPFVGGAEVAIKELTDRLPQYEWELVTVNLDDRQASTEQIGRVKVLRLPRGLMGKYLFPWRAAQLAVARHRQQPYQLVWAMMANQAGMAGARVKKKFPELPFLLTLQEGDDFQSWAYRWRLLGPRWCGVFRLADQIQAISHYLERWARNMGARCPITVIPNGVDLSRFQAKNPNSEQTDQDSKIIISTSRLVKKNGLDDLIKSLTFLPNNVKLQLVGIGEEERALKQLTRGLGLAARVSFLGYKPSSELPQYLAQADVFCRPSLSEGLGNSFLEAMASGLPTIGTPVGGIPDFLRAEETGWLCQVRNPHSIADQVKFILDPANQAMVTRITQAALRLVHAQYHWDQLAARFSLLLDSVR